MKSGVEIEFLIKIIKISTRGTIRFGQNNYENNYENNYVFYTHTLCQA